MEKVKELLLVFRKKYPLPLPVHILLRERYGKGGTKDTEQVRERALFTYDRENNRRVIGQLSQTIPIIEACAANLGGSGAGDSDIENKLIKKYQKELDKLQANIEAYDGRKLAEKYAKIIQKTVLKLWDCRNKGYMDALTEYLEKNGVTLISYEAGHKMTDDEIGMLEGNSLQIYMEMTEDAAKEYEVIQMLRPVICIGYMEEREGTAEYVDISGTCRFYCLERGERSL